MHNCFSFVSTFFYVILVAGLFIFDNIMLLSKYGSREANCAEISREHIDRAEYTSHKDKILIEKRFLHTKENERNV